MHWTSSFVSPWHAGREVMKKIMQITTIDIAAVAAEYGVSAEWRDNPMASGCGYYDLALTTRTGSVTIQGYPQHDDEIRFVAEVLAISNGVVLRSIIDTQSPSDAERVVRAVCSEMVRVAKAFALPDSQSEKHA